MVRELEQQQDTLETAQHAAQCAVQVIPAAQHASVHLVRRHRAIASAAATGDQARHFDQLQQDLKQGPGLDVLNGVNAHHPFRVHDLGTEARWPQLARRWAEVRARSVLSLPLFVLDHDLGVLIVLADPAGAFDEDSER